MLTVPIKFESVTAMNRWFSEFENKAIAICKKYSDPELWNRAVIMKDDSTCQVAIVSMGSFVSGSGTENAINEILEKFNSN